MNIKAFYGLLLLSISLFAPMAQAADTGWLNDAMHPELSIRLQAVSANEEAKTVNVLLQVELEGEWKTYWRSPGEGGIPPSWDWAPSTNVSSIDWQWPIPSRFVVAGIETLGYQGSTAFPLTVHVENWHEPVALAGVLTMSSCTNICVLTDFPIDLSLNPAEIMLDAETQHLWQRAVSTTPTLNHAHLVPPQARWDNEKQQLEVRLNRREGNWAEADVFIDSSEPNLSDIMVELISLEVEGETLIGRYAVTHWLDDLDLAEQSLQVTVTDNELAAEFTVIAAAGSLSDTAAVSSIWLFFGAALIGGLILNIMPCVLPVLGMKLQSVVAASGTSAKRVRRQFIMSALGIMSSFWLIAIGLIFLKASGAAIGWGIQFQNPYFIGFLALLTWLFALNLAGAFEVRLPSKLNTWAATKGDESYLGHYLQGMFATLLATPCSAPFLGTAIAFALAANTPELLFIFTGLGIGMSAPWLLIAAFPRMLKLLPKPGSWMNIARYIFALMLAVTAIWLVSLLSNHLAYNIIISALLVAFSVSGYFIWKRHGRAGVIASLAALIFAAAIALIIGALTASQWSQGVRPDHNWQRLQTADIPGLVADNKVVFVDVTASWCITCHANKIGVLLQQPVYDELQSDNVITVQGDWSTPSPSVTAYLRNHNQYGVPFNIVYGPGAPDGIQLPVILTSEAVLAALEEARGR
ncbi:cytochrome C biogenesis protein [Aliidiomarina iranensis]|uniref:Cytochrome C biogenesis protein n=1 Tax=Aliidiomarina iranensis TaxID=1434071 RepID=A0A432W0R2_9GAMM|nr:protein-disulfide reductase DsbD domain-containing protein [Aliidiomarina iranensis]RUO22614.1 cytochrome C biogenesis protein [Aliidiomarina iranensis]